MSDLSNDSSISAARVCECYKKLLSYGIPLYIHEENYFGAESPKIAYELAFPLPGRLEIDESITEYLVVQDNDLYSVFYHMAAVLPQLSEFDTNVLNFWFLDMFIEGLWTAQNANMNFKNQKITLLWIAYCFNHIQKENPSRSQFFDHLKGVLFKLGCYRVDTDSDTNEKSGEISRIYSASTSFIEPLPTEKTIWEVPYPPDYVYKEIKNADYSAPSSEEENLTASDLDENTEATQTGELDEVEESRKNCEHMKTILEIIYRIFGRLWVYLEIQTVLQNMPPTNIVDLPFKLPIPKPLLKTGSSSFSQFKTEKGGKKQPASERLGEVEFEKDISKNEFILPLQFADESTSILKQYFTGSSSQLSMNKQRKGQNF